jgi:hypothetical protein
MSKFGFALLGAVIAAAIAAVLLLRQHGEQDLRDKEGLLQQQSEQIAQLTVENERLSNAVASAQSTGGGDQSELLKLRSEVGQLRRQTNELGRLREENRRLTAAASAPPPAPAQAEDPEREQQRRFAIAKMNDAKILMLAFHMFANDNQNQLPGSFDEAKRYYEGSNPGLSQTNQFEIVYRGSYQALTNPSSVIVIREQQPFSFNGRWAKTYGFADGHSEVHSEPSGNFDAWEAQHMIPPPLPGQ